MREAALLVAASPCIRRVLDFPTPTSLSVWERIKDSFFRSHREENLHLVTETFMTDKWALDYRNSPLYPDFYAVNVENSFNGAPQVARNFNLFCTSNSLSQPPLYPASHRYTILESHISAARRMLPFGFKWALDLFRYYLRRYSFLTVNSTFRHQSKTFKLSTKRTPVQDSLALSSNGNGGLDDVEAQIARLYLGGTFSLLEISSEKTTRYVLESEGHNDQFHFPKFCVSLLDYSRSQGQDLKHCLPS